MNEYLSFIDDLEKLLTDIEKRINVINKRLAKAPEGSLRISKNGNKYQYYNKTEQYHPGKYIPRKDDSLAARLAQKDYDTKLLKILEEQRRVIKQFRNEFDPNAAQHIYEQLSGARKALVTPLYLSDDEFIKQWLSVPYKKLGFKEGDQEHYTAKGERVRSKSEVMIADALLRHNIPYRYEFPVYSHGVLIAAPDFNCLNVRLRKDYYWEHLGKLGDPDYANKNVSKIEKYTLADDFDSSSLILTLETDKHPLNTKVIEEQIRKYLL